MKKSKETKFDELFQYTLAQKRALRQADEASNEASQRRFVEKDKRRVQAVERACSAATAAVQKLVSENPGIKNAILKQFKASHSSNVDCDGYSERMQEGFVILRNGSYEEGVAIVIKEGKNPLEVTMALIAPHLDESKHFVKTFSERLAVLPVLQAHIQPWGIVWRKDTYPSTAVRKMLLQLARPMTATKLIAEGLA